MLYRFREAMLIEAGVKRNPNDKTPLLPSTCTSLPIAEQARRNLLKEISRRLTRIQEKTLDEYQIRILNDELNRMVREKFEWDGCVRRLGGIDRKNLQFLERLGVLQSGTTSANGYMYFGRAKELAGVQELLNPHQETPKRAIDQRKLDASYYGYYNDEPTASERLAERRIAEGETSDEGGDVWDSRFPLALATLTDEQEARLVEAYPAYPVPTADQVRQHMLELRKQELLNKFT